MIQVAICDDHFVVREGLRTVLTSDCSIGLVGEVQSCAEILQLVQTCPVDVLVLDIGLPDGSGINCISSVHAVSPSTRVLILTVHDEAEYADAALNEGATGYVLKDSPGGELLAAIHAVADGVRYTTERVARVLEGRKSAVSAPQRGVNLTERELTVVRLLAMGNTNAEIAATLCLSVRTVEDHRTRALRKLGLRSRSDLVRYLRQIAPYENQV